MIDLLNDNNGNDICLIFENKNKTYKQLNREILGNIELFKNREIIIILCNGSYENVLIYLTALRKGTIPLLLNEKLPINIVQDYIKRYNPKFLFCPYELNIGLMKRDFFKNYITYENIIPKSVVENDEISLLLTTSGSTGNPKVVKVSKNNLISNTNSICKYLNLSKKDRHITTLPFNYTYGLSCINTFLYSGGSIILNNNSFIQKAFWEDIEKYKPTYLSGVPYNYEILSKYFMHNLANCSIKVFTQAGGKLSQKYIELFLEFCNLYNKEFIVMYGQTEATARMSYLPFSELKNKINSIGKAIPGGKFSLNGEFKDERFQNKKVGELVFEGDNVTMGYAYKFADLNKSSKKKCILNTGDLAWIDEENFVYIVGRMKNYAKINGIRVSIDDVEKICYENEFTAAAFSNDIYLYIFIEDNNKKSLIELKKIIINSIQISPSSIKLKQIKKLPRLDSGKINYKALKEF